MAQRVLIVVGTRPNFVKVAPVLAELARRPESFDCTLVHTGQHYDDEMSRVFFEELNIGPPKQQPEGGLGEPFGADSASDGGHRASDGG